jgi:hypothetical protein
MNKVSQISLQRQVGNLISIVEICLPIVEKIKQTQGELDCLPYELDCLKQQAEFLRLGLSPNTSSSSLSYLEFDINQTEFHLDALVDDLERILANLAFLDLDIRNLLVLKEKLEAIQEERIYEITPERIYKLLEKQQQTLPKSQANFISSKKHSHKICFWHQDWKQKITDYRKKIDNKKIVMGLVIFASLSVGWVGGYYSSNTQSGNSEAVGQSKEIDKSASEI